MNNIKCKKGDIQVLVNPVTKQTEWQNPSNIYIYIGKVDYNENGQKRVFSGTPKQLGVFFSEKVDEIQKLKEEVKALKEFKASYKKTMKQVVALLEIVVPQLELNSIEINDILSSMEEELWKRI